MFDIQKQEKVLTSLFGQLKTTFLEDEFFTNKKTGSHYMTRLAREKFTIKTLLSNYLLFIISNLAFIKINHNNYHRKS